MFGIAARPVPANRIAGVQSVLTQPIRIDDAAVVEGEWGWIEETTAVACAAITCAAVIALARIAGLRSFTQMSAVDVAVTIATASPIARTAVGATPVWSGLAVIAAVLLFQVVVARLRRSTSMRGLIDSRPVPPMDGPPMDGPAAQADNPRAAGMVEADLDARLRGLACRVLKTCAPSRRRRQAGLARSPAPAGRTRWTRR